MAKVKVFTSRPNLKVKITRPKIFVPMERSWHKQCTCAIWKPCLFWLRSYGQGLSFLKVGQTSRSKSLGQKFWYSWKGLCTRNVQWWFVNPDTFVPGIYFRINEFSRLLKRPSVQKRKSVPALFVRISEISGLSEPGLTNHHCTY